MRWSIARNDANAAWRQPRTIYLLGHRLKKTWRKAEIDDNARGTLPLAKDWQARWDTKMISSVDMVMVQIKLRNRDPRIPFSVLGLCPKCVGVLRGSHSGGSIGGKPVDGDCEASTPDRSLR